MLTKAQAQKVMHGLGLAIRYNLDLIESHRVGWDYDEENRLIKVVPKCYKKNVSDWRKEISDWRKLIEKLRRTGK